MFEKTTAYIDKLIEEKKLPLLDVKVYQNHKELYRHYGAYGADASGKELLCMFSCTKVLTAVCGMRLIEEGKISLDDPVSKYIPEFAGAYTLTESGEKKKEIIKVRHLFTMSTGFDYNRRTPQIQKLKEECFDTAGTVDVIKTLVENPLKFTPGERFLYSMSHDALGALIEVVEGMNLAEYMQKYILDPLGMKNSTMFTDKYMCEPPLSYDITEDNRFVPNDGSAYRNFTPTKNFINGGAGLVSTVDDYAIFADTLAAGGISESGYRLIKSETIEKMKEPSFTSLNVNNNYTCVQGKDYDYGLGVRVRNQALECGIPKGEFGWDGAAGSYVLVDTDHGISITMGMNILSWPQVFTGEHLAIAKLIYEELGVAE